MRVRTDKVDALLSRDESSLLFDYLRDNIEWEDGIPSKSGPTRKAKSVDFTSDDNILDVVSRATDAFAVPLHNVLGVYINYYRDGNDFAPMHTHKGTAQIVVSLGCERPLIIGKKSYTLKSGDVVIFGGSSHGVPKCDVTDGRISIAIFCSK